jgi:hypothetical protein
MDLQNGDSFMQIRIRKTVSDELSTINSLSREELTEQWEKAHQRPSPKGISRRLLKYSAAYHLQVKVFGGLKSKVRKQLHPLRNKTSSSSAIKKRRQTILKPGARLIRDWHGQTYTVVVTDNGFKCNGDQYSSLSKVATAITGARWSGPRFFGL